jgi:hypothetical protein
MLNLKAFACSGVIAGAVAASMPTSALAADLGNRMPVKAAASVSVVSTHSGYIGLALGGGVGRNEAGNTGGLFYLGGDGAFNWWVSPQWSLQATVAAERTWGWDDIELDGDRWGGIFGGHITYRDPSRFAVGAFAGYTDYRDIEDERNATYALYGLEGQFYVGNTTFYGQLGGFSPISTPDGSMPDGSFFLRGVIRHFITPNFKLESELGWMRTGEVVGSEKYTYMNWGVSAEYRYSNSPVSMFVAYEGWRARINEASPDTAT